jgi:protein TonB
MTGTYKKHLVAGNITFVMSLVFHASLFICLLISRAPERPVIQVVEMTYAPPPAPPKSVRRQKTEQIVRQESAINNEKDKSAQYLSAHDQKVAKQTQAKNGKFSNERAEGKKQATETPEQLPDLSSSFAATKKAGDEGKKKNGKEMATDDYLKDVDEGMQTMLSTRSFAYYNYYTMIKDRIGQYWEPSIREKVKVIYQDDRSIASDSDHFTELAIVLDGEGQLLRVEILRSSGSHEIDDMAVKAFHSAAPFPKPPHGMVDSHGQIKIRYDFVIQS